MNMIMLPLKLMNKLSTDAMSMLDGSGIYWLLGIGAVVVIGGGIIYFKATHPDGLSKFSLK